MGVSRGSAVTQPNVSNMMVQYLGQYGYDALGPSNWRTALSNSSIRPTLALGVVGHGERDKHTFYDVQCRLQASDPSHTLEWVAQRRLAQLREGLHDVAKRELGKDYNLAFADAPFAMRGGLSGTTGRLQKWLETLADCVNKGEASPTLVSEVLQFLDAPAGNAAGKAALSANAPLFPEPATTRPTPSQSSSLAQESVPSVKDSPMPSKASTPRLTFPSRAATPRQNGPAKAATPTQGTASNATTPRYGSPPPKAPTPRQSEPSKPPSPRESAMSTAAPSQGGATSTAPSPRLSARGPQKAATPRQSGEGDSPKQPHSRETSRSTNNDEPRMCQRATCPPAISGRIGSDGDDDLVIMPPDLDTMASPTADIRVTASPLQRDATVQPETSAPLAALCASAEVGRRVRSASEPRIWSTRSCRLNELISNGAGSDQGTPTAPAEIIAAYLMPFGYEAQSEEVWEVTPALSSRRPVIEITVENNAKKGSGRSYEISARLVLSDPHSLLEWQMEYKLFGIREEIHDLVKYELGARDYAQHFGKTPFAMSGGPPGTTARLQKWMEALAATINAGTATPALVAQVLLALNAPAQAEHEAATRAMSIERLAPVEKVCTLRGSRQRCSLQSTRKEADAEERGECIMTGLESFDSTFCEDKSERRSRGIRKLKMWFAKLKRRLRHGRRCQSAPRSSESGLAVPRPSAMSATSSSTV